MILLNELTKSTIEINGEQKDLVIGTITPLFQYDAERIQYLTD